MQLHDLECLAYAANGALDNVVKMLDESLVSPQICDYRGAGIFHYLARFTTNLPVNWFGLLASRGVTLNLVKYVKKVSSQESLLLSPSGIACLSFASAGKAGKVLQMIKSREISPNLVDSDGAGIFHHMATSGVDVALDLVLELRDLGVPLDSSTIAHGITALHLAAEESIRFAQSLIISGARVLQASQGLLPKNIDNLLFFAAVEAAEKNYLISLEKILRETINTKIVSKSTILHTVLKNIFNYWLDPSKADDPVSYVIVHKRVVHLLVEKFPDVLKSVDHDGRLPIHLAALHGNIEFLVFFRGSYPRGLWKKDNEGNTPLHLSVEGWKEYGNEVYDFYREIVSNLCQSQQIRRIDTKNLAGKTPFHLSSYYSNVEATHLLMDYGADPSKVDYYGNTALHLAVMGSCDEGRVASSHRVISMLVNHHIRSVDFQNSDGSTPTHLAAMCGDKFIYQMMLEFGANTDLLNRDGKKSADYNGEMTNAIEKGVSFLNEIKLFATIDLPPISDYVARGVNLNFQSYKGESAIHLVVDFLVSNPSSIQKGAELIDALVAAGADPNIVDIGGQNPLLCLMKCVKYTKLKEVTKILLECGSDPLLEDKSGDSFDSEVQFMSEGFKKWYWSFKFSRNILIKSAQRCDYKLLREVPDLTKDNLVSIKSSEWDGICNTALGECLKAFSVGRVQIKACLSFFDNMSSISRVRLDITDEGISDILYNQDKLFGEYLISLSDRENLSSGWNLIVDVLLQRGEGEKYVRVLEMLRDMTPSPENALIYLNCACSAGHLEAMKILLSVVTNIDESWAGSTALMRAISRKHSNVVKILLKEGADPDLSDMRGNTPLYRAMTKKSVELTKMLLSAGADPKKVALFDTLEKHMPIEFQEWYTAFAGVAEGRSDDAGMIDCNSSFIEESDTSPDAVDNAFLQKGTILFPKGNFTVLNQYFDNISHLLPVNLTPKMEQEANYMQYFPLILLEEKGSNASMAKLDHGSHNNLQEGKGEYHPIEQGMLLLLLAKLLCNSVERIKGIISEKIPFTEKVLDKAPFTSSDGSFCENIRELDAHDIIQDYLDGDINFP